MYHQNPRGSGLKMLPLLGDLTWSDPWFYLNFGIPFGGILLLVNYTYSLLHLGN